jgi:hypothetical protein
VTEAVLGSALTVQILNNNVSALLLSPLEHPVIIFTLVRQFYIVFPRLFCPARIRSATVFQLVADASRLCRT